MIRTLIFLLYALVILILLFPLSIAAAFLAKHDPKYPIDPITTWVVKVFGGLAIKIAGISFEKSGEENIPDGPALFVGNHQGDLDVAIILTQLGSLKSILAKIEVSKLPFVHLWMSNMDSVFIDRKDMRQSLKALSRIEEFLAGGRSCLIFPEGTRSKGPNMNPFKPGSFKCAIKAGVPVVPFVLDGSYHAFEEHRVLKKTKVKVSILPPVSTEGKQTKALAEEVQGMIQAELDHLRAQ